MNNNILLKITFPKITLPVYTQGDSHDLIGMWTNYDTLLEEKIKTITVTPELIIQDFSDYQANAILKNINLHFDPLIWQTNKHGLIYTDLVFENKFQDIWHSIYKFPRSYGTPSYTEQGMQTKTFVSMETRATYTHTNWWAGFESAHQAVSLLKTLKQSGSIIHFPKTQNEPTLLTH
jgi:hypothetical protein